MVALVCWGTPISQPASDGHACLPFRCCGISDACLIDQIPYRAKQGPKGQKQTQQIAEQATHHFFTKTIFQYLNRIWDVWGCPGGGHGPDE